MTRERAISLLLANAEPLPPETDPELEALAELLERDHELAAWFASQSPADQALATALATVPIPPAKWKSLHRPTPLFTRRRWLTAAAASVVAGGSGLWWTLNRPTRFAHADGSADFAGFREDMARFAVRLFRLSKEDRRYGPLISWLKDRGATTPHDVAELPPRIAAAQSRGCKVIEWGAHRVGLICFHRDSGQIVHLFTTTRPALRGSLPSEVDMKSPVVLHGRQCAGWATTDKVFVLVAADSRTHVDDLLA